MQTDAIYFANPRENDHRGGANEKELMKKKFRAVSY